MVTVLVAMHRDLVPLRRRRHEPRRDSGPPGSRAGRTSPSISACGAFPARWVSRRGPGRRRRSTRHRKARRTRIAAGTSSPAPGRSNSTPARYGRPAPPPMPRLHPAQVPCCDWAERSHEGPISGYIERQCHHNCIPTVCRSVAASSATRRPTVRRCASVALRGTPLHFVGMTVAQSSDRVRSDLRGAGGTGGIDGALLAGIPAQTSVLTMRHRGLGCVAHGGPRPRR